jgi:NAD(P)H-hydrate epimerase
MVKVPALTSSEMSDLDRLMIEYYHVDLHQMMENAGRSLAIQSSRILGGSLQSKKILVLAGKGNNGGGGLSSARHMHNWGADVQIALSSDRKTLKPAPAKQLESLERIDVEILEASAKFEASMFDLIVDALLGYNQKGDPRGKIAELIDLANSSQRRILALDIPTGLDPDTGRPNSPCIRADQTLTLAFPKKGMLEAPAKPYVGLLFLADISIPREYYQRVGGGDTSIFAEDNIVQLT